jgi:hypothetical protein
MSQKIFRAVEQQEVKNPTPGKPTATENRTPGSRNSALASALELTLASAGRDSSGQVAWAFGFAGFGI